MPDHDGQVHPAVVRAHRDLAHGLRRIGVRCRNPTLHERGKKATTVSTFAPSLRGFCACPCNWASRVCISFSPGAWNPGIIPFMRFPLTICMRQFIPGL